jgi:8-oxo-dGTP pyrophosphatase MutT (NUDIX family)
MDLIISILTKQGRPVSPAKPDSIQHDYARLLSEREPPQRQALSLKPKPAATLILLDRSSAEPSVLMGRRNDKLKFMPGKFVFPGGRIEPGDRRMNVAGTLPDPVSDKLNARRGVRNIDLARPLALAAIRETFEETGLVLGRRDLGPPEQSPEGAWSKFCALGAYPDLEAMHFIGRAITPPGRARRFDTSFLAMDTAMIVDQTADVVGPDSELVEVLRLPLSKALELDLPMITWVMLKELDHRLKAGMAHDLPVPFYREIRRKWVREEI